MTRLIDADALKKAITEATYNFEQIPIRVDEVQEIIDNAPTVELFCSYLSDGEVKQPCVEAPCNHERPQGEWIVEEGNIFNSYVCSKCKEIGASDYKFCPNCGADMREADNDNTRVVK